MKKGLFNIVLALTLVVAGIAGVKTNVSAAEDDGLSYSWSVTYNQDKSFSSTYDAAAAKIKNAMPGDTITFAAQYINGTDESVDFYMSADVLKSLEDTSKAQGGAYSFKITNTINEEEIIFDSETVGGDVTEAVGLNQVSGNEGAYFALGSVPVGKSGTVKVIIALDGSSQTNNYMSAVANLEINFGAEATKDAKYSKTDHKEFKKVNSITKQVSVSEKKSIVKQVVKTLDNGTEVVAIDDSDVPLAGDNPVTGDMILPLAVCAVCFLVGICMIFWYIMLMISKKKEVA